ncbi:NRDE family protein [Thiocystis violascens]|uniref:Uncharacterized protein n=1 Tax=Thiocystis violascens (strain ATCC 17096 / DSM 198 / 6111) TaxID=765911 RepID=I3YFD1_THIV6|nr:NRDE family protein [Thiocystis violascens]AFL75699.1 hypothetical protein Thivi_3857 [Thiocystis violascens DSM 198]
MPIMILRRPGHPWPVLLAARRDAMAARVSLPPARHWPDRPEAIATLDPQTEGSWLGLNDHGVVAALLERAEMPDGESGQRSRGELVLEALDHAEASEAAGALADLHPDAYRPFNLLVADPRAAYWIRHGDDGRMRVQPIPPGVHLLAETELDDPAHPWIAAYLSRFKAAAVPDPERGDWSGWRDALANLDGVRSSALIALPAFPGFNSQPIWLQAEGGSERDVLREIWRAPL